jgi:hypothetical protein
MPAVENHRRLHGAIDVHVHTSPGRYPRRQSDLEFLADLRASGMAGAVLKAHECETAGRALLLGALAPGLLIQGGIVLNHEAGGWNPAAVEAILAMGGRWIWMPTTSAARHLEFFATRATAFYGGSSPPAAGLTLLDDSGSIRAEVMEILDLIARADAVLATGHLSPVEVDLLVAAARSRKVARLLIQHPDFGVSGIAPADQQRYAQAGCFIEKCYLCTLPDIAAVTVDGVAASIRSLGAGSCVVSTDLGQPHNPAPVEGFGRFLDGLASAGLADGDIAMVAGTNPRQLMT